MAKKNLDIKATENVEEVVKEIVDTKVEETIEEVKEEVIPEPVVEVKEEPKAEPVVETPKPEAKVISHTVHVRHWNGMSY